eukprot:COSAG02_NODE_60994_length_269_cov_2.452941_1_plen_67_part_10
MECGSEDDGTVRCATSCADQDDGTPGTEEPEDNTPPSVLFIRAWSDGEDMHYAKAGDVITVSLATSE